MSRLSAADLAGAVGVTSGADLSEAFSVEAVRPLLADLPHAAGFLGWGSDVLGYDTQRSTDHGWGPRCQVFVEDDSVARGWSAT